MKQFLLSLIALLALQGCGAQQTKSNTMKDNKSIVIFFSHAGDNYSVGNVKEGNTKLVADIISQSTGADRLEIVCTKDYDLAYSDLCNLAKEEQRRGELPTYTLMLNGRPLDGKADLQDYTDIYIGGPVWWGTYPQVMFTFFKDYDLSAKTIHPFTTHEGSGLGNCVRDLKTAYPNATFEKAFDIYGHEVRIPSGKKKVEDWLKG